MIPLVSTKLTEATQPMFNRLSEPGTAEIGKAIGVKHAAKPVTTNCAESSA